MIDNSLKCCITLFQLLRINWFLLLVCVFMCLCVCMKLYVLQVESIICRWPLGNLANQLDRSLQLLLFLVNFVKTLEVTKFGPFRSICEGYRDTISANVDLAKKLSVRSFCNARAPILIGNSKKVLPRRRLTIEV